MFKLVIADEEGTKTTVPLVRDEITIGRKEGNTIRLTERNISRTHAHLRRSNGGFLLRDLSSYNGVLVNGQRVESEVAINAGDQIKLGDYMMLVESDQPAVADAKVASPVPPAGRTPSSPIPPAPRVPNIDGSTSSPARLVMLSGPAPGTEFTVPSTGVLRMGRGAELDIPIDHRSVSREHAELRIGNDGVRLIDLESANGIRLNGGAVSPRPLRAGDVFELGQVAFRYVAPGEGYVFNPDDAVPYAKASGGRANWILLAVGALGLGAVAAVVFGTGAEPDTTVTPLAPAPRVSSVQAAAPAVPSSAPEVEAAPAPAVDPFDGALAACREAVTGERFAEAVAHATSALKARPDENNAVECLTIANAGHADEQAYVRGKAALLGGDAAAAVAEFDQLSAKGPFAGKPEIAEARRQAAEQQRAATAAAAIAARPAAPAPSKARPRAAPVRSNPAPAPAPAAEVALPSGQSPFQVASACLARGDNACVIKALTGRARTPQELGLLIETHRSLGNTDKATAGMEQYLRQFPTGPKASTYRRMLDRQGQ